MKYNWIIMVCILTILLNSCSNTRLINGTYSGKHNPHVFILSADSTFKYEYHAVWYSESSGTWRKAGDIIYLNSFNQTDKIPVEYTKMTNNQDSAIVVNIDVNSQNKPPKDYICWAFINGNFAYFDPDRGSYSFKSEIPVDSLYFKIKKSPFIFRGTGYKMGYDDVKTETIYPHLSVGESLNVTINIIDSLFGYKVFSDTKLKVKRDKLIFKDKNKTNKLSLRK